MKPIRLLLTLFLTLFLLPACGARNVGNAQNEWMVYHAASNSTVNPSFPPYSFEYPSDWTIDESANHITFASDAKLLKNVPEKLKSGQIIAGLSMNVNMSPEEMVSTYSCTLGSMIHFGNIISFFVNGHPAAYQEGVNPETGDQLFIVATDIGRNTRGLLTSRIAEGELELWKEILFQIAQSLQVEQ